MLLWIIFALLTAAVLAIILLPLVGRRAVADAPASAADVAVYRDQLAEIDSDLERGLIAAPEAKAARTEVSRRLLAQADRPTDAGKAEGGQTASGQAVSGQAASEDGKARPRYAFALAAIAIPALALSLYLHAGSPDLPGQPYSQRVSAPAPAARLDALIAKAEAQLRLNPKDGMGWDVLAPIYLRQQRFGRAAEAYARALDLLGETPRRLSGLAEAQIAVDNGIVSEKTRKLFQRLLQLQPRRAEARYWLAKAKEQDGRLREAAAAYRAMLASAPAKAPWRGMIAAQLHRVEGRLGLASTAGAGSVAATAAGSGSSSGVGAATARGPSTASRRERGPTAADIASAQRMSVADRLQMINRMVAGLAARLKSNGNDLPGWQKLVRAYAVLGQSQKAKNALATARKQFAGDGKALAVLDQLAKRFKLDT